MRKIILLFFIAFSYCMLSFAQDILGSWKGELNIGTTNLPLLFHISKEDGKLLSTLDSPAQGVIGYPVTSTTYSEGKLIITEQNMGLTYEAEFKDDELIGLFKQSGHTFPLNMARSDISTAEKKEKENNLPITYYTEEVTFENSQAGIKLAGEFTCPKEGSNFPIVVLVTGSGPQNRDEEIFGLKPFFVIADYFSRNGIAVLRYDDRGVAKSEGDYSSASVYDFASDAIAALQYVKNRPEINSSMVGLLGHSEGGMIAYIIAASQDFQPAFIISLAGPATPGHILLKEQRQLISTAMGVPQEFIVANEKLIEKIYSLVEQYGEEQIPSALDKISDEIIAYAKNIFPAETLTDEQLRQQIPGEIQKLIDPEFKSIMEYNPTDDLQKIKSPVLAVFGELDLQVPPISNAEALKKYLKAPLTVKIYPGLNHLFQNTTTGSPIEYPIAGETMQGGILEDMVSWIKGL